MKQSFPFDTVVLNTILLLYPIEQFTIVHLGHALGDFSPFRIVILPLCILYILYRNGMGVRASNHSIIGVCLFFLFALLSVISSGTISSAFSFIGNMVQFTMAYVFIRNTRFQRSTLYVITLWCISQIPSLVISFMSANLGMSHRFTGLFFDPNYLCAFVNGAIIAAANLYKSEKKTALKMYNLLVIVFGVLMIFMSYSRGGLLALLISCSIYLFVTNKKLLLIVAAILVPVISFLLVYSANLTWQDGADNYFTGFLYRTFTLSSDMSDLTAGRSDYAQIFFEHTEDYLLMGTDIFTYFNTFNHGGFIHNGFLEILIQGGIVIGSLFLLIIATSLTKLVYFADKIKYVPVELLICIGIYFSLSFLSFSSKLAWLCMGLFVSMGSKSVFNNCCKQ